MTAQLTHKRGDTFRKRCTWRDSTGAAIHLLTPPSTITAQLRTLDDQLVQSLTVTIDSDQVTNKGVFYLEATAAQTALWPVASLLCDIQRVASGTTESTQTFEVRIVADITR